MICTELKPVRLSHYKLSARTPVFEIDFETLPVANPAEPEAAENYDWVDFLDFETNALRMLNPQEVILPSPGARLVIDYPVKNPAEALLAAPNGAEFRRIDLARGVFEAYLFLYAQESKSSDIAVIPRQERGPMTNRNQTNGRFGIWGHDFEDLALHKVNVYLIDETCVLTVDMYS